MQGDHGEDAPESAGSASERPSLILAGTLAQRLKWPVAGAIVVLLGCLVWILWPQSPESIDLVGDIEPRVPDERTLTPSDAPDADAVIAARRLVVRGVVPLAGEVLLAANELVFEPDARLVFRGGSLTIVATVVRGLDVDASGPRGADGAVAGAPGGDGGTGGTVVLAAAVLERAKVNVSGGAGGTGAAGGAGAAGRNGYCGPSGFRLAARGEDGGDGGAGGNGGNGGLVIALYGNAAPNVVARGGTEGAPGRGGPGGRGGKGCQGVRGTQDAQSPGNDGVVGRTGRNGSAGQATLRAVDFDDVADAVGRWAKSAGRSPAALRDRLLSVRSRDNE
jgi:hypothetical protein